MEELEWFVLEKGETQRGVADGVTHVAHKRAVATFIDRKEPFTKFDSECDGGLTRSDGKYT